MNCPYCNEEEATWHGDTARDYACNQCYTIIQTRTGTAPPPPAGGAPSRHTPPQQTHKENTMVTESQIRAAIKQAEEKLRRQEEAVEGTRGMLELLKGQLDKPGPKK